MEPIRFADILFTAITLLIVYVILYWVHKSKQKSKHSDQSDSEHYAESDDTVIDIPEDHLNK